MIFLEDLEPLIYMKNIAGKTQLFSETLMQVISNSMSTRPCGRVEPSACRDDSQSVILKSIAIASILAAGVAGVAIPLVGKKRRFLTTEGNLFFAAKAFAAGVILATGFVHMLPDASSALSDPCLPRSPWSKFPFSGFVAMMASLATMVADFVGTQYYERKQQQEKRASRGSEESMVSGVGAESESVLDSVSEIGIVPAERVGLNGKVFGEEDGGGMHIVGIHAHTVHHGHSHPQGKHTCGGGGHVEEDYGHDHHGGHGHVHGHGRRGVEDEGGVRHVVVSQILEMGIVSHSVIIGLSLGVSHSPCTIRPLIGALSFHQFFEGFALGGCISQSHFSNTKTLLMACFFAITTPAGIGVGTAIASSYDNRSPRALAVEGVLDSVSAGILVYMALVDLIAADFMSKRMSCNPRLQLVSYVALFLGASLMSLLALWA